MIKFEKGHLVIYTEMPDYPLTVLTVIKTEGNLVTAKLPSGSLIIADSSKFRYPPKRK